MKISSTATVQGSSGSYCSV